MDKYIKEVNITYFMKENKINIDEALNEIVYLEVNSPLNYGIKSVDFYGRVVKVNDFYFEFLPYCRALIHEWNTEQIKLIEERYKTKRWAKKSIQNLYKVRTIEKVVKKEYEKTT